MPEVEVGRMPGRIQKVQIPDGSTVNDALAAATPPLDPNGFDVRCDGADIPLDANVEEGQRILLIRKIKGNIGQRARVLRFRR